MQPNIEQMARQSYQNSQNLQNQLNSQAGAATNQYNTAYNQAQGAQQQLQDFTKNMQSGADIYSKALQAANVNAGYDPAQLAAAQNQVSQITGILGGLPRAVQAQNANYGATAGDVAGQYSTEASNLNQSLGLANQNAANQLQRMQGGLTGAQAGATTSIQQQQNQLEGYKSAASNAAGIMDSARQNMNYLENLAQQQGTLTAAQQQTYAQARQAYAAAAQAYAAANLASQQAQQVLLQNQQTQAYMGSPAYQQYLSGSQNVTPAGSTPQSRAANLQASQQAAAIANKQAQQQRAETNRVQNMNLFDFLGQFGPRALNNGNKLFGII